MSYVSWFGVRFWLVRFGPTRSDRFSSVRFGSDQITSDRFGSDRLGSDRFSVICVIIGKSPYPGNIPSIPDYTKYRIVIACTVTVQLPMRVLHGMCYSCTSGGDDQSPNVVHYRWTMVMVYGVVPTNLLTHFWNVKCHFFCRWLLYT